MVNNPKRVMGKKKIVRYFYLKEPKSGKNLRVKYSRFEALGVLRSKSCREQTLIFFEKNKGMFSSTF